MNHTWNFPITELTKLNEPTGHLLFKIGAIAFKQNIDDSAILFPDAQDPMGANIVFDDSYTAWSATFEFVITKAISVRASRFWANSHDLLKDETTFTVSFDFPQN